MRKYIITVIFVAFFGYSINYLNAEEIKTNKEVVKQLKLEGVEVLGRNKVELEFDSKISDSSKDISIKDNGDGTEEIFVLDYNVFGKKVVLVLEEELKSNTEYEVIIFSIEGEDGSTITSGLDGALKFTTSDLTVFDEEEVGNNEEESKQEDKEVEMNSAGTKEESEMNSAGTKEESEMNSAGSKEESEMNSTGSKEESEMNSTGSKEEVEMNSAGLKKETKKEELKQNENLAGKDIRQEEVDKNIEVAASKTEELVKTGPEHILLSVLALILAALVAYIIKQRKNNKI